LPQVEKGIHVYKHENDFHCRSLADHLHKHQDRCEICDFILPTSLIPVAFTVHIKPLSTFISLLPAVTVLIIQWIEYYISLRAPPAVAG
jgi:hypothetical protein